MKKQKLLKLYALCTTILFLLTAIAFLLVFHKAGYCNKILAKLGYAEPVQQTELAVFGWNNAMTKLDYDADIVFFGDSITSESDFREFFPEASIVNLGCYGDTLMGMLGRVPGICGVNPETVFIMAGINGLTDMNTEVSLEAYETLLNELEAQLPAAQIMIQSVLPISYSRESSLLHNPAIVEFNRLLSDLAHRHGHTYIDLHSLYALDGELNPELTRDGLHLTQDSYRIWAEAIRPYIEK